MLCVMPMNKSLQTILYELINTNTLDLDEGKAIPIILTFMRVYFTCSGTAFSFNDLSPLLMF